VRKIFPIFLWFFSLIFSHQILVHRPCHDSYLCPQTEWGDTTFILPTRTSTESNVCKGKVRKVSFPYFFYFLLIFSSKSPPCITSTVISLSPDWIWDTAVVLHQQHNNNNRKQGAGQGRWGLVFIPCSPFSQQLTNFLIQLNSLTSPWWHLYFLRLDLSQFILFALVKMRLVAK
jgi:hypothetical protein